MSRQKMQASRGRPGEGAEVRIRPLREADLAAADRIMREAFGTFLGLSDPGSFMGDADYVYTRWRAAPDAAFCAELDGEVVGSNFATRWGSFAYFGPLSVRTDLWTHGIARRLLAPVMDLFETWGVRQSGLFTFPQSPKHLALYGKLGFHARYLTPIMQKRLSEPPGPFQGARFSRLAAGKKAAALAGCRRVADALFPGLDPGCEVRAIDAQKIGETVLLEEGAEITGFAACHTGAGSEAGSGECFIKFAAVMPGAGAAERFDRLLSACESMAGAGGFGAISAGVNLAREEAYLRLLERGYRIGFAGVAMHRPAEPAHCRKGIYALDDWR